MIIDSHVHIGEWDYEYYYKINNSVSDTNKVLDASKIDAAVAMPSDKMENESLLEELKNKGMGKYWFFPWVRPEMKGVMEFLEKNASQIAGIKMHGGLTRTPVNDEKYSAFLKVAEQNEMPVLCHAGRWQEMSSYKHTFELAQKYTGVKFIIAHQGGDDPKLKVESARELAKLGLENVWFDTSATREFWTIKMGVQALGAERFLFGSDYPVMHPKMSIEALRAAEIGRDAEEKILWKNAEFVLKGRPRVKG